MTVDSQNFLIWLYRGCGYFWLPIVIWTRHYVRDTVRSVDLTQVCLLKVMKSPFFAGGAISFLRFLEGIAAALYPSVYSLFHSLSLSLTHTHTHTQTESKSMLQHIGSAIKQWNMSHCWCSVRSWEFEKGFQNNVEEHFKLALEMSVSLELGFEQREASSHNSIKKLSVAFSYSCWSHNPPRSYKFVYF
jgi:hypothetical protein